mgnify:CR=1 FL=1
MINTLDFRHLAPWLADEVVCESQWAFWKIESKTEYEDYILSELDAIKQADIRLWGETGYTDAFGAGPCVILSEKHVENRVATILIEMKGDKIVQIDRCCLPHPNECRRTGEFPTVE